MTEGGIVMIAIAIRATIASVTIAWMCGLASAIDLRSDGCGLSRYTGRFATRSGLSRFIEPNVKRFGASRYIRRFVRRFGARIDMKCATPFVLSAADG